jgi:hypothetical protein
MLKMNRIPKFTAGMFKKKMPRFGAMAPKKPSMPRPPKPRIKKFGEGGDTDDLVPRSMLPDENAEQLAARARKSSGPTRRYRPRSLPKQESEVVVSPEAYYKSLSPAEQKKLREKYEQKIAEQEAMKREREMEERRKNEEAREMYQRQERLKDLEQGQYMRERRQGTRTARSGGVMKSFASRRGDGIAKKGKTRGKFL